MCDHTALAEALLGARRLLAEREAPKVRAGIFLRSCGDPAEILGQKDRSAAELLPAAESISPSYLLSPIPGFMHLGITVTQRLHANSCPHAEMNIPI